MRLADRAITALAYAACFVVGLAYVAWMHCPLRTIARRVIRWRTALLLEEVDADAATLRHLRDVSIPRGFRALAIEKNALLEQWARLTDGAPPPVPAPDPETVPRAAVPGPWSPNKPASCGHLFQQRNPRQ